MKKIGILFGQENTFPQAFVDRINEKNVKGISAELAKVEEVIQAKSIPYAVLVDRISQDVPFYRAYLKNAALTGTAVINNPFWWSADEKFFNNCLAEKIGIAVPNTVLLPSHERPTETSGDSFRNLKFPLAWEEMMEYIGGFPAYMKPHDGGGWKSVYKVNSMEELFKAHSETKQLVMMLQENIDFEYYFRCYCIGGKYVKVMPYEPRNPHHLRYIQHPVDIDPKLMKEVEEGVLKLNHELGYDFNTVEFAVRDGVPYAIDFCNPAPDADLNSVGEENFEWVVEHSALYAIERAKAHKENEDNLTWGGYIRNAAGKKKASSSKPAPKAVKKPAKKATSAKKSTEDLMGKIGKVKASQKDDLKLISGIGPKLETMLNGLGIFAFSQVAKMGKKEYQIVDDLLGAFKGRGQRDNWSGQAKKLK